MSLRVGFFNFKILLWTYSYDLMNGILEILNYVTLFALSNVMDINDYYDYDYYDYYYYYYYFLLFEKKLLILLMLPYIIFF